MGQVWDSFPSARLPLPEALLAGQTHLLKRRRRARGGRVPDNLRGLPPDEHLARLAMTYLAEQARHWPDLVARGVLPPATLDNAQALAESFK